MATHMDWFERITGFRELAYHETRNRLEVVGTRLRSKVNGTEYEIGRLETPLLRELRQRAERAARNIPGRLKVTLVSGDLIDRIDATPNIELRPHTQLTQLYGNLEEGLNAVSWRDKQTGLEEKRPIRHVFVFVGADPRRSGSLGAAWPSTRMGLC